MTTGDCAEHDKNFCSLLIAKQGWLFIVWILDISNFKENSKLKF